MADYSIPWKAPDLMPGLSFIQAARNQAAQNARADKYAAMEEQAIKNRAERESAALARQAEEDKRRHAIEAWNATPMLQRAALKSVSSANQNPYGLKFEEGYDLPANVEGPEPSPEAEAARFAPKTAPEPQFAEAGSDAPEAAFMSDSGGPQLPPPVPQPMVPSGYAGGGMDAFGDQERERAASNLNAVGTGLHGPQDEPAGGPSQSLLTQAAINSAGMAGGQQGRRRVYQVTQGDRFEIPEQSDKTGFGDKYDAIYQRALQEPGVTPEEAYKFVAKMAHEDATETGRNQRLTQSIGYKNANREDQQTFTREENAKYKLTFEQRRELTNIMARARAAAAGAGPVSPGLARLVGMKEAGATDEEIYAEAAKLHLTQKEVTAPVQNVVKNAAAGTRAQEKYASTEVTDEAGKALGHAHSPAQANTLKKQIDQFAQARVRLHDLIADIRNTGSRVLTPDELQNRLSKAQSVAAAMRVYNGLGATDASQKLESDIMGAIGTPGHGWLMGANLGVVERVLHEAEQQHQSRINTGLRAGGGTPLAPALGGPKPGAGGHPAQAPVGETRTGPDGRTYRKVGPNNWQPVDQ